MITFEQFISVNSLADGEVEKIKRVIEQPPFNFTWQPPESNKSIYNVFASRPFETGVDNIHRLDSGPCCFVLGLSEEERFPIYMTYPTVVFHTGIHHFDDLVEKWNSIRFFKISQNTFRQIENASPDTSNRPLIHWNEFNFYQSVQGNKIEKIIKTLEYMKKNWIDRGIWDHEMDTLILHLKLRYMPKDQISKRDIIRGALTL